MSYHFEHRRRSSKLNIKLFVYDKLQWLQGASSGALPCDLEAFYHVVTPRCRQNGTEVKILYSVEKCVFGGTMIHSERRR